MRRFLLFVALCMATVAMGGERKLLSMEDAILNRALIPQNYDIRFSKDNPAIYEHTNGKEIEQYDIRTGKLLSSKPILIGMPNPFRQKASVKENNVVWYDADGKIHKVTDFADKNIVCGQAISRHEFGIDGGLFHSPDNSLVAFYQKDESKVTTFPLLDITSRTGSLVEIKYPMNGMASERVSVGVYNSATQKVVYLNVTDFDEERYITNLTWSPDSKTIYTQVLNRAQKEMHLNAYNALSGEFIATILTEQNERWVEPQNPIRFIDNDRFIYTTDNRDGFKNLYIITLSKGSTERLTKVDADVEYVAHNDRTVFYYSAEISPVERHLFSVSLRNGKVRQLTRNEGWHNCTISPDGKYFSDNYSSLNVPRVVAVGSTDGKIYREVFRAENPSKDYNYSTIELGSVKSACGKYNNHYRLIKPLDFDENKKYPVILYVYGGPHSQMVTNSFQAQLRRWEMYMAQRGYVVFVMDNRGTLNQGAEYEKAIHRQCGKCEMEDQMAGLQWLLSHKWADRERVGVHGWSYGGFMTISLMTHYPEVFKVGVAGGPVIDWKWYEVMYGERYMESEKTNPEGFAATSLISQAKNLKCKLLICQGAIDDVVVWQHSLSFIDACIDNGVAVDYFPYPRSQHNVRGKWRVHLMQKVTDYFEDYLR
ncbi:MAG: DPP IV N-terminal domain-containing protein [Alistipes sp.]|nr:DPP IV N-terminal domain-containing protein [Alistipes sp.]